MAPHHDANIGDRIRSRRTLLGLSVRQAADRAGLAASTLSRIERGLRSADNRFVLAQIAEALRCPVADLTGQPETPTDRRTAEAAADISETVRAAIEADLRYGPPEGRQAPPLSELDRELDLVRDLRVRCDDRGVAQRMPNLLRGLHAAASGPARAGALRGLVLATDGASFVVRYFGDAASACMVAERTQQAAEELADPVLLGLAGYGRAHAAIGCGLYERAGQIAAMAATDLESHTDLPDAPEMLGQLYLTAAFALIATGDRGGASDRVAEAERIAERTGESPALRLGFGPTNNRLWRISMEVDGGEPGKAVEIARDTTPQVIGSTSREVAFYLDTGRALARVGKDREAIRMLLTAERLAPQRVRRSPFAAEAVRSLLERSRRTAGGPELRGLVSRMGLSA